MAFPALIQKIFDLRQALNEATEENTALCAAVAALSEENIHMSRRITLLELGACPAVLEKGEIISLNPSGFELPCGAKVAPVTLVAKNAQPHPGAALTVVVDDIQK